MNETMTLEERIRAFFSLGDFLRSALNPPDDMEAGRDQELIEHFCHSIEEASARNPWFIKDYTVYALREWGTSLTNEHLRNWVAPYEEAIRKSKKPVNIGVIAAGNIPAVGFHDFLCTLVSGNVFIGKLSRDDRVLLPALAGLLCQIEPRFSPFIRFTEEKLSGFDAVIATGSNNTSRYFEYYFGKYPHIIRRNRNGVAVLKGDESPEQLAGLGDDISLYFGMGCRSVSKVFIPRGYDPASLFDSVKRYDLITGRHHRYMNNYAYNKAVYLLSEIPFLDNGNLLLVESAGYPSPVAVIHYAYYDSLQDLTARLQADHELIQCIASDPAEGLQTVSLGQTQRPGLRDYADGVDTMQFLAGLTV